MLLRRPENFLRDLINEHVHGFDSQVRTGCLVADKPWNIHNLPQYFVLGDLEFPLVGLSPDGESLTALVKALQFCFIARAEPLFNSRLFEN